MPRRKTSVSRPEIIDEIPFTLDEAKLFKSIRMEPDSEDAPAVREMAAEALRIGRPKAVYREVFIEEKGEDHVAIEGHRFASRILRVNLEQAYRVFPYVATCGRELQTWSDGFAGDMLKGFWAESVKIFALRAASDTLGARLSPFHPSGSAVMNPGSLEDWPMSEQRPLFDLIGDPEQLIGVRLTDSFLMVPTKSVSGIRFPTEVRYENCQLCPREKCPGRRAPHDKDLYERKYRKGKT
jgi:hypothetical protein